MEESNRDSRGGTGLISELGEGGDGSTKEGLYKSLCLSREVRFHRVDTHKETKIA